MQIGAQLYNLRDYCKTLPDLANTLARVAQIGFKTVQLSGVCEYTPEWISAELAKNGLTANLTHYNPKRIAEDTAAVIEEHKGFGCKYIGIGAMPDLKKENFSEESYLRFVERYLPAARMIRDAGCKFMYHNHNFEFYRFPDGRNVIERLCDDFAPDEMGFTLDTYWVTAAGGDPIDWLNRLAGRLNCVHFKDMCYSAEEPNQRMAPIGSGNLNWPKIIETCNALGVEYVYIEQDHSYGEDPFVCLEKGYAYLHSLGAI